MAKFPLKISTVTRRYLWDFLFRMVVTVSVAVTWIFRRVWLDFTTKGVHTIVLVVLWVGVILSMLAQLNPKTGLTVGCHKQYPSRYEEISGYSVQALQRAVKERDEGALKVAVVWGGVNVGFGILYHLGILDVPTLVLFCALCFLGDLVCVLFFCPFQTFLMKNRCCVNCRIFAWGSWMMAAPLMCVPHWYAQTLFWTGILVLVVWEARYRRYPERFWEGSNSSLNCASCPEHLCRYKFPRSPRFRAETEKAARRQG